MCGEAGRSAISIPAIPGDTGSLGEQVLLDRKFVIRAEVTGNENRIVLFKIFKLIMFLGSSWIVWICR